MEIVGGIGPPTLIRHFLGDIATEVGATAAAPLFVSGFTVIALQLLILVVVIVEDEEGEGGGG